MHAACPQGPPCAAPALPPSPRHPPCVCRGAAGAAATDLPVPTLLGARPRRHLLHQHEVVPVQPGGCTCLHLPAACLCCPQHARRWMDGAHSSTPTGRGCCLPQPAAACLRRACSSPLIRRAAPAAAWLPCSCPCAGSWRSPWRPMAAWSQYGCWLRCGSRPTRARSPCPCCWTIRSSRPAS